MAKRGVEGHAEFPGIPADHRSPRQTRHFLESTVGVDDLRCRGVAQHESGGAGLEDPLEPLLGSPQLRFGAEVLGDIAADSEHRELAAPGAVSHSHFNGQIRPRGAPRAERRRGGQARRHVAHEFGDGPLLLRAHPLLCYVVAP